MRPYPVEGLLPRALDIVGGRWTLLVIDALAAGPRRYSELLEELPGIATNLLAERLRELERDGLVRRRAGEAPQDAVRYELTECGAALTPVLERLAAWARQCAAAAS